MTREETAATVAFVRLHWPHSNLGGAANEVVGIWHSMLAALDVRQVENAVRELSASGREFAPPVGLVVKTVAERTVDTPDFDAAWAEIEKLKMRWNVAFPGREKPPVEAFSCLSLAEWAIPTWREFCLAPAPGTNGYGTFYAQTREAWKAHAHREQRSVALSAVGAPRRRTQLVRPDWPAALPAPSTEKAA